ncbi:MAG TPA: DUF6089 family protein [Fulvivirga sp.]|nr:DUF6089 family protein [Fulvivirga sp.]
MITKGHFIFGFILLLILGITAPSFSQINRKNVRKNNKRMANFKGKKQNFTKDKKYNFVGFSVNAFNYFGDLSPSAGVASTDISFTRPGFGVFFGHRFGPRYSLRGSFTYGTIRGDDFKSADKGSQADAPRYIRNLSFRNRIKELTVVGVFDLYKNESSYISRLQFTPYAFIGLTVFHHNPQAYVADDSGLPEAGTWVDLKPLGTEGQNAELLDTDVNAGIKQYKLVQLAIPFGIGARYRLNQVFDISMEFGIRYTFTDYLDDVSQNYVDPGVFTGSNAELARYMADRSLNPTSAEKGQTREIGDVSTQSFIGRDGQSYTVINGYGSEFRDNIRGNKKDNDVYFVTSIKLAYIIGATFTRAKFR